MIIQNLHKIYRNKKQEARSKTFLSLFFILLSLFSVVAQDSIPAKSSVSEQKNLAFQKFFFKALSEKAIRNYQKAIENLEEANLLIPNNKAVLFEFSKNYYTLNKFFEALEYGNKALEKDAENLWILEHLVKVYKQDRNYTDAIKTQSKIAKNHPKKKQKLVFLYLQNLDFVSAKRTLKELEKAKLLTSRLRRIKEKLYKKNTKIVPIKKTRKTVKKSTLRAQFKNDKSFVSLKKLFKKLTLEKSKDLLTYSEQGLRLFPAQPLVYLMNGKALNNQKSYKKALESLQNGFDFVIDDTKMEVNFYSEIAIAYQGLGNTKEADKFLKKAKK